MDNVIVSQSCKVQSQNWKKDCPALFLHHFLDIPVSCGLTGSLLWLAGRISSFTTSEVLASSCVASISEQCSVLVPSIDRRMSPTCSAPHLRGGRLGQVSFCLTVKVSVEQKNIKGEFHLSTTLAAFILSIIITCLLLYIVVVRLIPRLEEWLFTISTSRGPEACCTASETDKTHRCDRDQHNYQMHLKLHPAIITFQTEMFHVIIDTVFSQCCKNS